MHFTTAELVGGKRMDIMRKASHGAYDKLALKKLKTIAIANLSSPRRPGGQQQQFFFVVFIIKAQMLEFS